jgi:ATP adenylyltransferase
MEGNTMERLWAPWRMEFILQEKDGGCFLCDAVAAGPEADRELLVLERGTSAFVIMNRYPYNNGHLLVSPKRHGGEFGEMTAGESAEVMALAQKWQRIICESMSADGFNMGMNLGHCAGAGVADHLHLHIVPRWNGDTNFMPVLADAHVVPQALAELYDKLQGTLRAHSEGGDA